jgi:methylenetetrahydrofolate--tRNA-(uracil-5-)-methyltransferase
MRIAFKAARYGKGGDDYINCPFDKEQYETFYNETRQREIGSAQALRRHALVRVVSSDRRNGAARRRHSALRPDEAERFAAAGNRPRAYAAVQLRQENLMADAYSLVGFRIT